MIEKPCQWFLRVCFVSSRILFENILARANSDFVAGLLSGLSIRGVAIFSEKYKFDSDSVMFLRDDNLTDSDHVALSLQLAESLVLSLPCNICQTLGFQFCRGSFLGHLVKLISACFTAVWIRT